MGSRYEMLVCVFNALPLASAGEVAGTRILVIHHRAVGFVMAAGSRVNRIVIHLAQVGMVRMKRVRRLGIVLVL
jgi:hypothetical protein